GDQVNRRNIDMLRRVFGAENMTLCSLDDMPHERGRAGQIIGKIKSLFLSLRLYAGGLTPAKQKRVMTELSLNKYDYIFLSDSQLGRLIPSIKKKYPSASVATFFHNVMINYAKEYVKTSGWSHLPFYMAVKHNETITANRSDICITLNSRESTLLEKIYGRSAECELPISYDDRFDDARLTGRAQQTSLLFVGINFFANVSGIRWFCENVMPHVDAKLVIVGSGMDSLKDELAGEKVEVHGFVSDLDSFYYNADLVVLPIFTGGGMKTKTAEAMMFGRSILGTKEAFAGYDIDFSRGGALCESAEDFIRAIVSRQNSRSERFNPYCREQFLRKYSNKEAFEIFRRLFSGDAQ
ncbi:MAG: glycosyltransferase, partial [Spirochaetota bacterium]